MFLTDLKKEFLRNNDPIQMRFSKNWISNGAWAVRRRLVDEVKLNYLLTQLKHVVINIEDSTFKKMISVLDNGEEKIKAFYLQDWIFEVIKDKTRRYCLYRDDIKNQCIVFNEPYIRMVKYPKILWNNGVEVTPFFNESDIKLITFFIMPTKGSLGENGLIFLSELNSIIKKEKTNKNIAGFFLNKQRKLKRRKI